MKYLFILLFAFCLFAQAEVDATAGSLVMVRCDNGDDGFVSSPSDINLTNAQNSFDNKQDTIVLVHGFNNSFDSAKESFQKATSVLRTNLGNKNFIGFYWPSDTYLDFAKGVENANQTGKYLMHVLAEITRWYGGNGRRIHIISHSLGGRVLLSTLKENAARYVAWGQMFSMAAAVHNDTYLTKFSGTNTPPQKTWVYFSRNDDVLKYLYSLYYWLFDMPPQFSQTREMSQWTKMNNDEKIAHLRNIDQNAKNGKMPEGEFDNFLYGKIQEAEKEAMGLVGAKLVSKVDNIDMSNVVSGHSYWDNAEVMRNISSLLK